MLNNLIIISGFSPGRSGVGRLISYLINEKRNSQNEDISTCKIVWGHHGYSGRKYLKEGRIIPAIGDYINEFKAKYLFKKYFKKPLSERILLIHPQALGFLGIGKRSREALHRDRS